MTSSGERRTLLPIDAIVAVVGVVMIMYIWFSTLTFILIPWAQATWDEWFGAWIVFFTILHVLLLLSLWSFIMAAFTGPGEVPLNYRSFVMRHAAGSGAEHFEVRWCKRCEMPKPPRAHHCSHGCDVCVLKMDHHCPWIANCVGFLNHGHFLRYVLYTWFAAGITEVFLTWRLIQLIWWPETVRSDTYFSISMMPVSLKEAVILLFNTIWLAAAFVMLGILAVVTLRNVLTNCTTIEQLEVDSELKWSRRTGNSPLPFPFNAGVRSNLELVLGKRLWAWPFPLPSSWQLADLGEGITFPVDEQLTISEYQWPPCKSCSSSSCSSFSDSVSQDDPLVARGTVGTMAHSDTDVRYRARRSSDEYILPSKLPWHSQSELSVPMNKRA